MAYFTRELHQENAERLKTSVTEGDSTAGAYLRGINVVVLCGLCNCRPISRLLITCINKQTRKD